MTSDKYKIRDFSIYLYLVKGVEIKTVARCFKLSPSRVRQIIKKVDSDYSEHARLFWNHVDDVESQR